MLAQNHRLLQALKGELAFFESGGYGRCFRSDWRSTLLLRDSPTCINFSSAGALNPCRECPLFRLVPSNKRQEFIPCHYILLDSKGSTIAGLYRTGSQESLDRRFCEWLSGLVAGLEQCEEAL
jgi:hypothetical protein